MVRSRRATGAGAGRELWCRTPRRADPPATATYTLTIAAPKTAPTFASGAPASGVAGTAYTFTLVGTGNPAPSFAATGSLPAGLTLDPATGIISGTPTTAGTTTFTISATNAVNPAASAAYTLTVGAAAATLPADPPTVRADPATVASSTDAAATTDPVTNAASTQRLASTGFDPAPTGLIGTLLVILGAGALIARRRATRQG